MRPPATPPKNEQGFALLLVLVFTLVLIPLAGEFAFQVQMEARTAQNVADQLKIDNAIDGQFDVVLARLEYDATQEDVDSYSDSWNADEIKERREDETQVALSTQVFDEQGKFNVLLLARAPVDRRPLIRERMIRILVECRKDTKDPIDDSLAKELVDDLAGFLTGTRNRGGIPNPKTVDDRPILLLDDLKFVNSRFGELLVDVRVEDQVEAGLQRYLTVYGTGKLNLNTADPVVLRAFFPSDTGIGDRIKERRDGSGTGGNGGTKSGTGGTSATWGTSGTGGTSGSGSGSGSGSSASDDNAGGEPFTDVNQVMDVDGVTVEQLQKDKVDLGVDFDVRSNFFSVRINGQTDVTRRDELYVVERVKGATKDAPLEGFRYLLHQERTDPLEDLADEGTSSTR